MNKIRQKNKMLELSMFRKNIVLQSWKPVVWCMPISVPPELNLPQKLWQSAQPVAWKHRNVYPGENTQIHWVLETMRSKEGSQARVLMILLLSRGAEGPAEWRSRQRRLAPRLTSWVQSLRPAWWEKKTSSTMLSSGFSMHSMECLCVHVCPHNY